MATAWIESDDPCDWGKVPLDDRNYTCDVSADGLHDWFFDHTLCLLCGGQLTYCTECGAEWWCHENGGMIVPMEEEIVDQYLIPVDPMDLLECDSCQ